MTREEIVAYARRDWAALAAVKADFWREEKARVPAAELFRRVHVFRERVLQLHPDRPTDEERAADLAAHVELSRKLRAGGGRSRP